MPLIAAAAGAGLGGLKYAFVDLPQNRKDIKYQAATARMSPWTGMSAQQVKNPSLFNNVLQGGAAGASFGQSMGGAAPLATTKGAPTDKQSPWSQLQKQNTLFEEDQTKDKKPQYPGSY